MSVGGCASVGIALLGVGATAGATHHMNGIQYWTFTEPRRKVETAAQRALKQMGVAIVSTERLDDLTVIKGATAGRRIELEVEPLTARSTRMRSVAYQYGGIIVDAATGGEIIRQTQLALDRKPRAQR